MIRLAALLLTLVACDGKPRQYDALGPVTRIQVIARRRPSGADTFTIRDADSIARIVAFVNARRDGWETPWGGVPIPTTIAEFYDSNDFRGHFGSGSDFFETQRDGDFSSRSANADEFAAFQRLLGIRVKVIRVPPKSP
ncbi:MAG TPA: hypothetical protein VJ865_16670 [Gemmatimonadaceae bacterium]|nr:hypothetical protein [Gemmatimonadaceae bacterium]